MESSLRCPRCQQIDQVRKVSAIYQQETGSFQSEGGVLLTDGAAGYTAQWGSQQSNLASLLTPPPLHYLPAPLRWLGSLLLYGGTALGLLGLAGLVVIGIDLLGPHLSGFLEVLGSALAMIGLGLGSALLGQALLAGRTSPARERAVGLWSQLYYCGRCDGAYLPSQGGLVPSTQVPRWLASR